MLMVFFVTPSLWGWEAIPAPEAFIHTNISWVFSPTLPQVPDVIPRSHLCPWCFGHSLLRGMWQSKKILCNQNFEPSHVVSPSIRTIFLQLLSPLSRTMLKNHLSSNQSPWTKYVHIFTFIVTILKVHFCTTFNIGHQCQIFKPKYWWIHVFNNLHFVSYYPCACLNI